MCCGPYSLAYHEKASSKQAMTIDTESFRLSDFSGLPPAFLLYDTTMFYFLRNDAEGTEFKVGIHGKRDLMHFLKKVD